MRIGTLSILLAAALAAGPAAVHAQERPFTPVTQEMLLDPDPADWINWRRTLDGWGYSPLDQIDTENAHRLQLAWSWAIGTAGRPEPNPLVYDGVLYIASPFGIVEALDAATGELLWRYRHEHEAEELTGIVTTRNLAIYDDKVYLTTVDAHIVALDARTGDVVWNVAGADYRLGFRYTAGPIVVGGRVIASTNGCERFHEAKEMPCFISARDAQTGEEVWRTSTVARPGEPGGDTWGDTPLMFRIGGDSWTAGSYDPGTNLIYWATAQAKPWARFQRGHSGDALYTKQRPGARPGQRRDRLVQPAPARRDARHGRDVREPARRPRLAPVALQDGQAGDSLGARPRHRPLPGRARPGIPDDSRRASGDRRHHLPARHDSARRGGAGILSERGRLQELAGDGLPSGHPRVLRAVARKLRADHVRSGTGAGRGRGRRRHLAPDAPDAPATPGRGGGVRRRRRRRQRAVAASNPHRHRQRRADHRRRAGGRRRLGQEPVRARRAVGGDPVPDADAELRVRVSPSPTRWTGGSTWRFRSARTRRCGAASRGS